jgi:hypothetical protein
MQEYVIWQANPAELICLFIAAGSQKKLLLQP